MGAGRRDLREAGDKRVIWRAGRRSRGGVDAGDKKGDMEGGG